MNLVQRCYGVCVCVMVYSEAYRMAIVHNVSVRPLHCSALVVVV